MQKAFLIIIIACFSGPFGLYPLEGQTILKGRVVDEETEEPLAFVNIVFNEKGTGTTTNIDGFFSIDSKVFPDFLRLSYVGYEQVTISTSYDDVADLLILTMKRKPYLLEEVTVSPGINPAHQIIEQAFSNRRLNNPEMLSSFSYTSYNKLILTFVPDSILSRLSLPGSPNISIRFAFTGNGQVVEENLLVGTDSLTVEKADSSVIRMREFIEKQHLFLMESVSEREYRRPGRNNEQVIASRVSGFQDPSFSLLATQLQSFSFYEDFISLLDRRYLNPISRGSSSRYSFTLEDSMFTEQNDTLFIISFRPYSNRNFDGLQGVVYINSNRYAVQNVIAEPYKPEGFFTIRVHQNYSFIDNNQWFPYELNTDVIFSRESVSSGSGSTHSLIGIGKSYISNIEINPGLSRRRFNHVELTIARDAHRKTDEFWEKYRIEPLSVKDLKTYHVIDSIGKKANFDRTLGILEALATGYIPWGFMNIDYTSLLDYNYFEGLRPGLRAKTNDRVSRWFSLGGHVAWGSGDKEIKYGGEVLTTIYRPGDVEIRFSYSNDVEEAGNFNFLENNSPFSSENYRRFMIGRMDYVEQYNASFGLRFLRHFKGRLYFNLSEVRTGDNYTYLREGVENNLFRFTEAGLQLRFAYRERFMQTPKGNRISMGTDFPVFWFNYGRGLDYMGGEYGYTRLQAGVFQTFSTKSLGKTSFMVEGGIVDEDVPLQKLFNGKGSFRKFSLEAANSFATMRMLEFVSSQFVSFFFRQNFESLLFRTGKFRPEFVFITNIGFGNLSNLSNHESHLNIPMKAPEKGYYESGLLLNNIYRQFFLGYGIGVFYRYGPYAFNKPVDNLAFKLTFNINLR